MARNPTHQPALDGTLDSVFCLFMALATHEGAIVAEKSRFVDSSRLASSRIDASPTSPAQNAVACRPKRCCFAKGSCDFTRKSHLMDMPRIRFGRLDLAQLAPLIMDQQSEIITNKYNLQNAALLASLVTTVPSA